MLDWNAFLMQLDAFNPVIDWGTPVSARNPTGNNETFFEDMRVSDLSNICLPPAESFFFSL